MVKGPGLYTDIGKKARVMCMPIQLDRDADSIGFQDVTEVIHNKAQTMLGIVSPQVLQTPLTNSVMQGVRREVGKHARVLNRLTTTNARKAEEMSLEGNEEAETLQSDQINEEVYLPLKESIGPTLRSAIFDE